VVKAEEKESFLTKRYLQLILFGGKGGTGKTTSAAATAVYMARLRPKSKVLVVSTDPAHSLGDSFDCPLGDEIAPIEGIDNVWGLEVDAPALMADYKRKHWGAMWKIAQRGTFYDDQDIDKIVELTLPGLDEIVVVMRMADMLEDGLYDLIIMDTAPTGHTLRFLELPAKMARWAEVMGLMLAKHRYMSKLYTGRYRKDDADAFTRLVGKDLARVNRLLRSYVRTRFIPVTIPEPMSIFETERLVAILEHLKVPVTSIIVNRVAQGRDCVFCQSRKKDQQDHLPEIEEKFAPYNLIKMPLFPHEVRGLDALTQYAEVLSGNEYQYRAVHPVEPLELSSVPTAKLSDLLDGDYQFLMFGGKGGVGKTTSSAAIALRLARHNPDKKMLIFSTDPAHSLGDSFACAIGNRETQIEGNLYAIEIDAQKLWRGFEETWKTDVGDAFDFLIDKTLHADSGARVSYDKRVMVGMIDTSPLGIDEVMALEKIVDLMNEERYDLIILDTAPTGHLIRFLETPELARDWLKTLFEILVRYRRMMPLVVIEDLSRRLIKLSKGIRGITKTLMNPENTEFVAVTIPEAMGILETEDLLSTLKKLKVPCRHLIINMVIPPTDCSFCATKRQEQQRYVQQVKDGKSSEYLVTEVELFPHEISGIDDLTKYAGKIF